MDQYDGNLANVTEHYWWKQCLALFSHVFIYLYLWLPMTLTLLLEIVRKSLYSRYVELNCGYGYMAISSIFMSFIFMTNKDWIVLNMQVGNYRILINFHYFLCSFFIKNCLSVLPWLSTKFYRYTKQAFNHSKGRRDLLACAKKNIL